MLPPIGEPKGDRTRLTPGNIAGKKAVRGHRFQNPLKRTIGTERVGGGIRIIDKHFEFTTEGDTNGEDEDRLRSRRKLHPR